MNIKTILLLALFVPVNVGAAIISVVPSVSTISLGETFTVDLIADFTGESVLGWGLDLSFNDSVISQVGLPDIGGLWSGSGTIDGDGLAGLWLPSFPTAFPPRFTTHRFRRFAGDTDV